MSYFDFPHTRNYDTDLGYIIKKLQEVETTVNEFSSINEITYHDPIKWDITTQYTRNTIVVDGYNTYLSKQPVPAGVDISNEDYWLKVADFTGYIKDFQHYVTKQDLGHDEITANALSKDNLIIFKDKLYKVLSDIEANTKVIIGTNIEEIDVNTWVLDFVNTLLSKIDTVNTDLTSKINATNVEVESNKALINANTDSIVKNETAIKTLDSKVDSEVNDIHSMISDDETKIENNTQNITTNTSKIKLLEQPRKKNIILLGDSYSYGIVSASENNSYYGWKFYFRRNFSNWFNVYMEETTSGHNAFIDNDGYLNNLKSIVGNLSIDEKNNMDELVLLSGLNDLSADYDTLNTKIKEFIEYTKSTLPNCKIRIGVMGAKISRLYQGSNVWKAYSNCISYGAEFISDLLMLFCQPNYISDGTHYTYEGYDICNPYIAECIAYGHTRYEFEIHPTVNKINSANINLDAVDCYIKINEQGICHFILNSTTGLKHGYCLLSNVTNNIQSDIYNIDIDPMIMSYRQIPVNCYGNNQEFTGDGFLSFLGYDKGTNLSLSLQAQESSWSLVRCPFVFDWNCFIK